MIAIESGHWYDADGNPAYTQPNKSKGGERPTTVRDARKLDLVPSVTSILKVADKPALTRWKLQQVAMAAITLPPREGEPADDFLKRVWEDSGKQSKEARDRGTAFHGSFERYLQGKSVPHADQALCDKTLEVMKEHDVLGPFEIEKSFARYGYGGKCDMHSTLGMCVADLKTKDKLGDKKLAYDEHAMQLAAYRAGFFDEKAWDQVICANVFVGLDCGEVKIVTHTQEDLSRAWEMFKTLRDYWYLANKMVMK